MGFYSKFILPRLIERFGKGKEVTSIRAMVIPNAAGAVLELGIGSGLNLPFYSGNVKCLYGVDPSPELLGRARTRAAQVAFPVVLLNQSAEQVPLEAQSVDTVVSTWVMCSIPDLPRVLREINRVLKPDGRLIFAEHGLSADPEVQKWQNRITPIWRRMGGGCTLNKKIDDLIGSAGFQITELNTGYIRGLRPLTYIYQGSARPS
ncbi:MAG: class I SAM-dependent methyltransferase [Gemmataceae bacterium]